MVCLLEGEAQTQEVVTGQGKGHGAGVYSLVLPSLQSPMPLSVKQDDGACFPGLPGGSRPVCKVYNQGFVIRVVPSPTGLPSKRCPGLVESWNKSPRPQAYTWNH